MKRPLLFVFVAGLIIGLSGCGDRGENQSTGASVNTRSNSDEALNMPTGSTGDSEVLTSNAAGTATTGSAPKAETTGEMPVPSTLGGGATSTHGSTNSGTNG